MRLDGERTLPGRPQQVWEMLLDPDVLVAAIPGCEQLDRVGEDHYEGKIEAKVGSVESRYDATFKISEKDPPSSYRLRAEGEGSAGFVNADATMRMQPGGGDGAAQRTTLHYDIDAQVGGRIAQVGQRMVRATASAMLDKGFNDLRTRIERELQPESATASGSAAAQRSSGGGLGKALRAFFSAAGAFLKALFSSPSSSEGGAPSGKLSGSPSGSASSTTSQASSAPPPPPAPSETASDSSESIASEGGQSDSVPPPPPGGSSSASSSSEKASSSEKGSTSEGTRSAEADTSGMPPPPGAS